MALTKQQLLALISSKIYTNVANEVSGDDVADVLDAIVDAVFASQADFTRKTERIYKPSGSTSFVLNLTEAPYNSANYFIFGDKQDPQTTAFSVSLQSHDGTAIYDNYFFAINEYPDCTVTIPFDNNLALPNGDLDIVLSQGDWVYCVGAVETGALGGQKRTQVISSNKNFFAT